MCFCFIFFIFFSYNHFMFCFCCFWLSLLCLLDFLQFIFSTLFVSSYANLYFFYIIFSFFFLKLFKCVVPLLFPSVVCCVSMFIVLEYIIMQAFTFYWNYALAPGILDKTFDKSTPVNAFIAGGNEPTKRVTSPVQLSLPPISTISSVLANGADISAAI